MTTKYENSWTTPYGLFQQVIARFNDIRGQADSFFGKLDAEKITKYLKRFRDPANRFGPQPVYSSCTLQNLAPFLSNDSDRVLAWLVAPFIFLIENRHAPFLKDSDAHASDPKSDSNDSLNPISHSFDPTYKRAKPDLLASMNGILNKVNAFQLDGEEIYSSRKSVALSKSDTFAIAGIQYYLLESVRVTEKSAESTQRKLKDFELDFLTCALLSELSSVKALKALDSGLLDKRLRRRDGKYKTTPSEIRARFEEKYVAPSELGKLLLPHAQNIYNGDASALCRLLRKQFLSLARGVPLSSFFKQSA